jgi:hypothetical protein
MTRAVNLAVQSPASDLVGRANRHQTPHHSGTRAHEDGRVQRIVAVAWTSREDESVPAPAAVRMAVPYR